MNEPRFERHQLGEILQKAAELQEGRADAGAADRLGLRELQQLSEEGVPPSTASGKDETAVRRTWLHRLLARLFPRVTRG